MTQREIRRIATTLLAIAAALLLALVLGGCGEAVPPVSRSQMPIAPAQTPAESVVQVPAQQAAVPEETTLTKAQAEAVALNHAGLTAAQVKGLRSEFDIDGGVKEWDVEFRCDGWEYDYEIHAVSGTIRSFEREKD